MSADLTYFWQNPRSTTTSQNQCGEKIFLSTTGYRNAEFKLIWFLYFPFCTLRGGGYIRKLSLSTKRQSCLQRGGVITQWSRHDNVLGFLFIWQTSLLISRYKRPSQEDILASSHWSFLPKFHCGCTVWKQKRALLWLSPLLSSNSNLLFALSNISKGGHSPINAGPFSAIVVFSPIDYVLKGRSHDFYKKYYLEIESNSFAFLHFSLGVVKVHLWSQTINMCNKKTDWCANWSSCLKMFSWLSKNIPALTKL